MMGTCETCQWFKKSATSLRCSGGECRVNAPVSSEHVWPLVKKEDFCGEYDDIHLARLRDDFNLAHSRAIYKG